MKPKSVIFFSFLFIFLLVCLILFSIRPNNHVKLPKSPDSCNRIISLAPNITEILFALGLGDKIIGVSEFCNYPPQAANIPKVGALLNPNFEAIIAAKPDLVIILDEMAADKNKFDSLGIDTLIVKHDSLEEILDSINLIAARCGKSQQAEKIVTDIRNKIKNIQNQINTQNRLKVLVCLGRDYSPDPAEKPQNSYIAGNDGFYSQMVEYAGGQNAYTGKLPFPAVSTESVISMNPQIIIDILPTDQKQANPQIAETQWKNFNQIDAVKNNRIYIFTEDFTAIPGPRFILTLEKIARIINPDYVTPVKTGVKEDDEPNSN